MKKIVIVLIIFSLILPLFTGCSIVQVKKGINAYVVPNTVKYRREDDMQLSKEITSKISVSLARNEYEGGQFIIKDIENSFIVTDVSVPDLFCGKNVLSTKNIEIGYEYYMNIYNVQTTEFQAGFYPDAIIPMQYADDGISVKANENQGYWITVYAPKNQAAGIYEGNVSVKCKVGNVEKTILIPISVEVWDIELSDKHNMFSEFGLWNVTLYEGQNNQYYDFFQKYRCTPGSLPVNYDNLEQYMTDIAPYAESDSVPCFSIPFWYYEDEDGNISFLDKTYKLYDALKQVGYLSKAYIYIMDEPSGPLIDKAKKLFPMIKKEFPGLRNILPITFGIESEITEYSDTLVLKHENADEALIEKWKDKGLNFWWYNCNYPTYPSPTFHIADYLHSSRIMSWMQKDYNINGFLYWSATINFKYGEGGVWEPRNIWEDAYIDPDPICPAGDGYLVYQAREGDGVVNANVPIPTIRLESIRDGFEDYEYLCMLEDKYKAIIEKYDITDVDINDIMESYYDMLYVNPTDYNLNCNAVLEARKIVANDLIASDDVIVSVVLNNNPQNGTGRSIHVYAPENSNVTLDGVKIVGEKNLYKIDVDATTTHVSEIIVNEKVYTRTIAEVFTFDYDSFNNLQEVKDKISCSFDFEISATEMYDVNLKDTSFFTLDIKAPIGSKIKFNGKDCDGKVEDFRFPGKVCGYTVEITYNGETKLFKRIAVKKMISNTLLVDFSSQNTVDRLAETISNNIGTGYTITNGKLNLFFDKNKMSRFTIKSNAFTNEKIDVGKYTNICFEITNQTDRDLDGISFVLFGGSSSEKTENDMSSIKASQTKMVSLRLPTNSDGTPLFSTLGNIRIMTISNVSQQQYTISNIQLVNME